MSQKRQGKLENCLSWKVMNIKFNKNLWDVTKAVLKELCSYKGFDEERTRV